MQLFACIIIFKIIFQIFSESLFLQPACCRSHTRTGMCILEGHLSVCKVKVRMSLNNRCGKLHTLAISKQFTPHVRDLVAACRKGASIRRSPTSSDFLNCCHLRASLVQRLSISFKANENNKEAENRLRALHCNSSFCFVSLPLNEEKVKFVFPFVLYTIVFLTSLVWF